VAPTYKFGVGSGAAEIIVAITFACRGALLAAPSLAVACAHFSWVSKI
jgi:hypothetical protein